MLSASRYSLLALFGASSFALAQTSAPGATAAPPTQTTTSQPSAAAAVEMPSDPAGLLALAAKKNGSQNLQAPWHLKATYEALDDKGNTADSGTFEEFWVSATKSKSSYSSASFNQIFIENEKGIYRHGDAGMPRGAASLVKSTLFHQIQLPPDNNNYKSIFEGRTLGGIKLRCITVEKVQPPPISMLGTECLDANLPLLRISGNGGGGYLQTLFNQVIVFQGVYIARDMEVRGNSKTVLHIHIDMMESYSAKEDEFAAGPEAIYWPHRVTQPGTVQAGNIVRKVTPEYPEFARQQRIQGVVVLSAIINKDGKIIDLQPIVGPSELIRPSIEAVRRWEYKPYLLDGVPVEVETEIDVIFQLR